MNIGELFKIKRGNSGGQDGYVAGPMPLVAAGTLNNAVVRFVQPQSKDRVFSDVPCLTVAVAGQGGSMFATVQSKTFIATHHIEVLEPRKGHPFWAADKGIKLIAIAAFIRKQRWRSHFMRSPNGRLSDIELDIPSIQAIVGQISHIKPKIKTITQADVSALLAKLPNGVAIQDLFDTVKRNTFENSEARESGAVPLVSASSNNNAVVGFVDAQSPKDIVPGNTISVAKDGVPMIARVQVNPYAMNTHVIPLQAKAAAKFTDKELAILAALIENQGWRYNYMRAAAWGRMGPQVIA